MSKEEKKIKISYPLFTSTEEAQLENTLNFHLEEFVNEINKTMSKDKDIIILKKVIKKQQKEIEEKTTIIMAGAEKVKQLDKQIHNLNIEKIEQQKEIEELKNEKRRNMELAELLDKQEIELKSMKRELEIEKGCSISKDKIREKIKKEEKYQETIKKLFPDSFNYHIQEYTIEVLKELLEE